MEKPSKRPAASAASSSSVLFLRWFRARRGGKVECSRAGSYVGVGADERLEEIRESEEGDERAGEGDGDGEGWATKVASRASSSSMYRIVPYISQYRQSRS